ncbi:LysR family transcriptional regulator [Pseudomonas savastanoi pv. fraxini]|uniref:LysR family transcriptional regulator n=1 Tax=Pseudomonas savastanoi TaxID=29438 RepID=UPI00073A2234|nr:LysR family transcriptional regulator [Pseudomonas savastanoi]KUG45541.1 Transcriptional regulator, LysR family [Pseudomonas savastanoi pv. fraxini]KWS81556.1 LysR family transcriptional regulator [Pseudomonas savastanoi pv. fraxini]PAB31439.1 LysR family transcriptional regulator [Pseudomonas savastanoi pv. fraxini]RMR70546.1 Transcriptional regulator, LysR family [Pseudomonas savastanoi pv. fraxini]RMR73080.1 Transcriptional regulator, LysR family [Pseudomonas savastanoi pv. fraxini]
MDIQALNLFVRSMEMGNITAAGAELGLVPSVASQKLAKLEKSLGMRLLHRTTRQVTLTEDGALFLPHASRIIAAVDEAYFTTVKSQETPKRVLRISAPGSFARVCLMPAVTRFLRSHPNLKIDLVLSDEVQNLTEIGIDVAIRIAALKDSTHVARKLGNDTRILCASPAYLEQKGEPGEPEDLSRHDCITLGEENRWHFAGNARNPFSIINGSFRVNCGEAAGIAAVEGLGIASISLWNARASLNKGDLVEVLSSFALEQSRAVWAIYPSSRQISSKARAFVDFLIQEFVDGF